MSSSSHSSSSHSSTAIDEKLAHLSLAKDSDVIDSEFDFGTFDGIFDYLSQRERPRLSPLREPYEPDLRDKIEALSKAAPAVRAALHVLNDDLQFALDNYCLAKRDVTPLPDRTCSLLSAIIHRRSKLYLESEQMWKTIKHPLLNELYRDHGGPVKFQNAIEGADGKRVSEARRAPLEQAQFEEMKTIAKWAAKNSGPGKGAKQ
ncbi:hypothetical protein EXIGLDRAFT_722187 [Exidia glandulosa HHB12029]|uniref:Uncharacterized protein n=1 Tax=Exidia glandulosa HHB12029 TaxID=1314781 RepID=A0A165FDE8_EXIGL|nr:hypothetical protein EXIGLDRAFT_722187 [Exidia glandulosa HHB12029]